MEIFVTVGTTEKPFNRLIKSVDQLAKDSNDRFIVQIGHSTFEPKYCEWFRFKSLDEIQKIIIRSDIVVSHGGFGIISHCIRARKKVIACPRLLELNEAVNPQIELVRYLHEKGFLISLIDTSKLGETIQTAKCFSPASFTFKSRISDLIKEFIETTW